MVGSLNLRERLFFSFVAGRHEWKDVKWPINDWPVRNQSVDWRILMKIIKQVAPELSTFGHFLRSLYTSSYLQIFVFRRQIIHCSLAKSLACDWYFERPWKIPHATEEKVQDTEKNDTTRLPS